MSAVMRNNLLEETIWNDIWLNIYSQLRFLLSRAKNLLKLPLGLMIT